MIKKFQKKLLRRGKDGKVIVDAAVLESLNINKDSKLKLETDGESVIITPIEKPKIKKRPKVSDNPKVQTAFEEITTRYSKALKKLSKS